MLEKLDTLGACLLIAVMAGTFLYFEEDILHYECLQQGLHLLYSPKVQVLHLEDVATDKAYRTNARKEKMKLQESVRSMEVLLNLMRR